MLAYKKNNVNMAAEKKHPATEERNNVLNFSDMKKQSSKCDFLLETRMPKSTFSMLSDKDKEYVLCSEVPEVFGTGEEFELQL